MSKGTVLVADDDKDILDIVRWALEDADYVVLTVMDGRSAVQEASRVHPDVVLMDVMMPVMDGIEASRLLREDPATEAIPIILMSARSRLQSTAELGVNGRLAKPFELDRLIQAVERWVPRAPSS